MRPSPEEQARLKAEKEAKKVAKKAKYGDVNSQNYPVVEMRIPLEIDLEKPPWDNYIAALEDTWRFGRWLSDGRTYDAPVKRKVIRT